jgi:ferredoxin--NADP+ reductase
MPNEKRIGSVERPLRVAVIGSGPSGFYAAEALLGRKDLNATCDVFDRLPTPYGLIRGGVAPDHQNIKRITAVYEKVATHPRFRFLGNLTLGKDLTTDDLKQCYDAIIYATGTERSRRLGIPGEDLPGCYGSTDFVGWYNGHPDHAKRTFDLDIESAIVIGNGNVSIDTTRVLTKGGEHLATTDMPSYAVEALRKATRLKRIYLLGRRGPAEVAFTPKEIKELGELPNADLIVDPRQAELDSVSRKYMESSGNRQLNEIVEFLAHKAAEKPSGKPRQVILKFLTSPVEVLAGPDGRVAGLKVEKNLLTPDENGRPIPRGTGEFETIEAGLIIKAIGHVGSRLPGVPYDDRRGIIPNVNGRLLKDVRGNEISAGEYEMEFLPGEYVVGWAKRGPSGLIGVNKLDSIETVKMLFDDFASEAGPPRTAARPELDAIEKLLKERGIQYVPFSGWKRIDQHEVSQGKEKQKVREKLCGIDDLLGIADGN